MRLDPDDGASQSGGSMTIGGYDHEYVADRDIVYTPIKDPTYYVVAMSDLLVDEQSVRNKSTHQPISVVDSGVFVVH